VANRMIGGEVEFRICPHFNFGCPDPLDHESFLF
jgi:hypothetical protein